MCLCLCLIECFCLIHCGNNFVISRDRAPSCQSCSPSNLAKSHFEYLCHFSGSIMAVAQFVIYGFSAYNLHPDCCTALSLVASRLPSEVWALPLKMFSLGGLHLPIMQKLFTSRNFAQIMQSFYFHVPIPFWPYLLSTQIRTLNQI